MYIAVVSPATPEPNCTVLALATPTWIPFLVPLVIIALSYNSRVLNAVDSPLINVTSGVPYRFVIFAKLPTSKVDTPALTVLKSLALFISLIVGAIFSISKLKI